MGPKVLQRSELPPSKSQRRYFYYPTKILLYFERKIRCSVEHIMSIIQAKTNASESTSGDNPGVGWHAPVLRISEMSVAAGDPTISDDGLGDGLFS